VPDPLHRMGTSVVAWEFHDGFVIIRAVGNDGCRMLFPREHAPKVMIESEERGDYYWAAPAYLYEGESCMLGHWQHGDIRWSGVTFSNKKLWRIFPPTGEKVLEWDGRWVDPPYGAFGLTYG